MQCHRPWLPVVAEVPRFAELLADPRASRWPTAPATRRASRTRWCWSAPRGVGPTEERAAAAGGRAAGAIGAHVLRAETAAVAVGACWQACAPGCVGCRSRHVDRQRSRRVVERDHASRVDCCRGGRQRGGSSPGGRPGRDDDTMSDTTTPRRPAPTPSKVGTRLRAIRRQKRLSLQDVEAASSQEFKASVLGAYERGERAISVPRLQRLARFYRVPVDQLLPGDDGPDFGPRPGDGDLVIDLTGRARGPRRRALGEDRPRRRSSGLEGTDAEMLDALPADDPGAAAATSTAGCSPCGATTCGPSPASSTSPPDLAVDRLDGLGVLFTPSPAAASTLTRRSPGTMSG